MQSHEQTFALPDEAHCDALASALTVADEAGIPREDLYIGAGTALTMRWQHRPPTGVWLFLPPDDDHPFRLRSEEIQLSSIKDQGGKNIASFGSKWTKWTLAGIPTGIYLSDSRGVHASEDIEAGTGLMIENASSAFRKKFYNRIIQNGDLVPRDALDMAELSLREPQALESFTQPDDVIAQACSKETAWQALIEPEEILRPLWRHVSDLFLGKPDSGFLRHQIPESLLLAQPGKTQHKVMTQVDLLPDEAFLHPLLQERAPLDEGGFALNMASCMAGHPLDPSGEEIQRWLLAKNIEELPDNAESYMREYFKQLSGAKLFAFRQNCGASLRDIARMARWPDFLMSPKLKAGVNRPAKLLASRDRVEEVEGYRNLTHWIYHA